MSASVSSRAAPVKPAQHEHAPQVVAGGNEFLGHQIHPVVETRHVAEVRRSVDTKDVFRLVMSPQQDDWR